MQRVLILVAGNGGGHIGRASNYLRQLLLHHPGTVNITLVGGERQLGMNIPALNFLRQSSGHEIVNFNGHATVKLGSLESYTREGFFGWEEGFREIVQATKPDLVISDNLPGVLLVSPEAVLSGNFFWGETLRRLYPSSQLLGGSRRTRHGFWKHSSRQLFARRQSPQTTF